MKKLVQIIMFIFFTSCLKNKILVSRWCSYNYIHETSTYYFDTLKSINSDSKFYSTQKFLVKNFK